MGFHILPTCRWLFILISLDCAVRRTIFHAGHHVRHIFWFWWAILTGHTFMRWAAKWPLSLPLLAMPDLMIDAGLQCWFRIIHARIWVVFQFSFRSVWYWYYILSFLYWYEPLSLLLRPLYWYIVFIFKWVYWPGLNAVLSIWRHVILFDKRLTDRRKLQAELFYFSDITLMIYSPDISRYD